jgi:hypothetical protein
MQDRHEFPTTLRQRRTRQEATLDLVLIDEVLPAWHWRERHRQRTDADPATVLRITQALTWDEVRAFRILMRIRAGGRRMPGATVIGGLTRMGFTELVRGPDEIVYGGIGRPWRPHGRLTPLDARQSFVDFAEAGYAKMAFNFQVAAGELTTETRVYLTDARARRAFAGYWLVIRPWSGWIRREWLAGVVRRAATG